jgi:NADPH:quinone reductase-like Zn-dependent oxidoreductase
VRANVLETFGGLDSLVCNDIREPEPKTGPVVIQIKAFGVDHVELPMRRGEWAEAAAVSGIECASLVFGTPGFPLSNVPLRRIAADAATGQLDVKPVRVFRFDEIGEAQRVMEADKARGKIVVVHD